MLSIIEFFKALKTVKTIIETAKAIYVAVVDWMTKLAQKKEIKKAEQAVQELKDANNTEDANERIKQKAEAACKLEKSLDPSADC